MSIAKPQIIVITETKLLNDIPNSELGLHGFTIFRQDRNNNNSRKSEGGGVLIAISSTINSIQISIPENRVEQIYVRINYLYRKIIVGAVYISSDSKAETYLWHDETLAHLNDIYTSHEMMIFGDYNLRKVTWSKDRPSKVCSLINCSNNESELANFVQNQLSLFNFSQNFPNHPNKGYTLDLFFSNLKDVNIDSCESTDYLIITDRHHLYLEANLKFFGVSENNSFSQKQYTDSINDYNYNRNFFQANFNQINLDILETDWDNLLYNSDVNFMIKNFYSIIYKSISDNVPEKINF